MKILKDLIPYVVILVVVILLRIFVITPVRVEGTSMNKNLNSGDILMLYKLAKIDRYDIVVLNEKIDKENIIKRVYALPGETIQIKNKKIYINDSEIEDPYHYGDTNDFPKTTLKDDEYFVLGDNRLVSKDSRIIGPIKKSDIKGQTVLRIWPLNQIKTL